MPRAQSRAELLDRCVVIRRAAREDELALAKRVAEGTSPPGVGIMAPFWRARLREAQMGLVRLRAGSTAGS